MSGHIPFIVAFGVFGGAVLILVSIALRVERRQPDDITTGDPMNPEALRDWRKAKWPMEKA